MGYNQKFFIEQFLNILENRFLNNGQCTAEF